MLGRLQLMIVFIINSLSEYALGELINCLVYKMSENNVKKRKMFVCFFKCLVWYDELSRATNIFNSQKYKIEKVRRSLHLTS